MGNVICLMNDA